MARTDSCRFQGQGLSCPGPRGGPGRGLHGDPRCAPAGSALGRSRARCGCGAGGGGGSRVGRGPGVACPRSRSDLPDPRDRPISPVAPGPLTAAEPSRHDLPPRLRREPSGGLPTTPDTRGGNHLRRPRLVGDPVRTPTRPRSRGEAASRHQFPQPGPLARRAPADDLFHGPEAHPDTAPAGTPPEITVGDHHPKRETPQQMQGEAASGALRQGPGGAADSRVQPTRQGVQGCPDRSTRARSSMARSRI